ncbi:serine/threonine protein kinase [Rubinisphaera italica]|uniref:non-specific serine/threonine protein kinase n=1 Tax=Rubinisphaera italica TaxID=2527969 RepID=A0A5C5XKY0_9PLAN|nr:serine/threonine-protein kinase [Rubinisphaera italica]TWT63514.1 Serine/threonine-protein kinase PrkC [Rubinisphaera italica]
MTSENQEKRLKKEEVNKQTEMLGASESSHEEAQVDLSNKTLGEFRLIRRLGKGGMANVYLAEQTALNRHVAIKVMKNDLVSDATYLDRFKTEAMAAANLNHINIVQVYTIGEADGYNYIAQEYVQGVNLREFIAKNGPPELSVSLHLMKQIASALQKAGEVGIVHRDIKPENIMISRKGIVKIADFGLAQLTLSGERMNLTQEGVTMGTPLYMSPEQVKGNKVDHRSDIYSLGVTCYHMLAGRPPFRGQTAIAIAMKHVNSQPAPLSKRRPDLPVPVCDMIHKMMAKKVTDRYQDAGEILIDLRKISRSLQGDKDEVSLSAFDSNTGAQTSSRAIQPSPKMKPISWSRYLVFGILFLAAGGTLGWLSRPRLNTNPQLNAIERNSPREQFADAMLIGNSEDAWKYLRVKFPTSQERWRAEERLAIQYMNQGRLEEARRIFETFIEQASDDKFNLVPVGFAGRAVIAALEKNYQASDQILADNAQRLSQKLNGPMKPLVRETILQNEQHLENPRMTLSKMFPEETTEG